MQTQNQNAGPARSSCHSIESKASDRSGRVWIRARPEPAQGGGGRIPALGRMNTASSRRPRERLGAVHHPKESGPRIDSLRGIALLDAWPVAFRPTIRNFVSWLWIPGGFLSNVRIDGNAGGQKVRRLWGHLRSALQRWGRSCRIRGGYQPRRMELAAGWRLRGHCSVRSHMYGSWPPHTAATISNHATTRDQFRTMRDRK